MVVESKNKDRNRMKSSFEFRGKVVSFEMVVENIFLSKNKDRNGMII